ncbi:MAG: hypothetical protein FWD19_03755, partial [Defluviitaleaceae bacterium]|nr:hypothetical protein [Defluviitaleaceae bacterium]
MKKILQSDLVDLIIGSALLLITAIMPLMVRVAWLPLPEELFGIFPESRHAGYNDIFAYYKGLFLLYPAVIIAVFYVNDLIICAKLPKFKEIFSKPPIVISFVYLAFVVLSAVLSDYTRTSWFGTYDRGEGAFMWLAYFVIMFAAMYFSRDIKRAEFVLYGLVFSSILMGAIGVGQFVGHDFFRTEIGKRMITFGTPLADRWQSINVVFEIAHGTLFNPNTFGKYTAMIAPIFLLAGLSYQGKKFVNAIFLIAGVLMALGLLGSGSLGGLIGIGTAMFVLLVTPLCCKGNKKFFALIPAAFAVAGLVAFLFVAPINERVSHLFGRLVSESRVETTRIPNFIFDGNKMTALNQNGEIFSLTAHGMSGDWITVNDANGNEIPPARVIEQDNATVYIFNIPNFTSIRVDKFPSLFQFFPNDQRGRGFRLTVRDGEIQGLTINDAPLDVQNE